MNEYLWEFAQNLPGDNQFQIVLKSVLSLTASAKADIDEKNNKWMCRKCKTLWMHGYFDLTEVEPTDKFDKTLEKYEDTLDQTRKQRKFQKYMQTRKKTTAKFTCHVCSYKTRVNIRNVESTSKPKEQKGKAGVRTGNAIAKPRNSKTNNSRKKAKQNSAKFAKKKDSSFSTKNTNQLQTLVTMLKRNSGTSSSTNEVKDRLKLMLQ